MDAMIRQTDELLPHEMEYFNHEGFRYPLSVGQSADECSDILRTQKTQAGDVPSACYPPSAGFLVRSQLRTEDVVRNADEFQHLRQSYTF